MSSSGLFRKYARILVSLVGGLIILTGALEMASLYREIRDSRGAIQRIEARSAALRIEQYLSAIQEQVKGVGRLPWDTGLLDARDLRNEYQRLMRLLPPIAQIRSVGMDGRERLRASRIDPDVFDSLEYLGDNALFQEARAKGVAYGPSYFRDGSEPYVTLAILDDNPGRRVTMNEINLKFVGDVLAAIGVGKQGAVYVLDGNNQLVAHPDPRTVLRKMDLSGNAAVQELRREMESTRDDIAGMVEGTGLAGAHMMMSGAYIPSARWLVVSEEPYAEVFRPVWKALARDAAILAAGLIAAVIASYFLARRLAQPILEVRQGAERIAKGDLATRIEVHTGDEIEALAAQFNTMAGQLQEYTAGLERKVAERTSELEAAMRARSLFLAAASHDLRQPLYAISLLADAVAAEPLPPQAAVMLGRQRQAIAVLRTLFDNLLDLSRFESGAVRSSPRDVSLRDILQPIGAEYEMLAHSRNLEWHAEVPDVRVHTDPELLRRLAANLLSNAVRYTQKGSVSLRAQARHGYVVITVADTGVGIAPEDRERVFEEFVQLANPARDRAQGVGLGLAIVKRISELLGARMTMESTVGEGTRITFQVPLAIDAQEGASAHEAHLLEPASFSGRSVWAVEDDPLVRDGLAAQFAAWGIRHAFALDRESLERLREEEGDWPDAILLDDMLGAGEQGLEIAVWLSERVPADRIVLVTGNVNAERTLRLEQSRFVVLRKPLASSDLAQCLRHAMRVPVTG